MSAASGSKATQLLHCTAKRNIIAACRIASFSRNKWFPANVVLSGRPLQDLNRRYTSGMSRKAENQIVVRHRRPSAIPGWADACRRCIFRISLQTTVASSHAARSFSSSRPYAACALLFLAGSLVRILDSSRTSRGVRNGPTQLANGRRTTASEK
jgi:hypothetical protein